MDEIPLYVLAGTILSVGPVIQYSEQASDTSLEIRIYPGKNGSFKMVEDDGSSYNYIKADTRTTVYNWNDKTKTLTWKVSGAYAGKNIYKTITVVVGKMAKNTAITKSDRLVFK